MSRARDADLVFVVAPTNRGWILEGICREVEQRHPGVTAFHYGNGPLPPGRAYFFTHYMLFQDHMDDPALNSARSLVWFTHPSWSDRRGRRAVVRSLERCSRLISTSSMHAQTLRTASRSLARKTEVVLPGVDHARFEPHARGGGAVGLCSAYYARKAPGDVLGLVRALPHRRFRLLGRGWEEAPQFEQLMAQANFEYLEAGFDDYPTFYRTLDVFVSPSVLEGGPIPLLEAMASNVVPVATRTGFAPDLISHGDNGLIVDVGAGVHALADAVERAFALEAEVSSSVAHLTWDRFAERVIDLSR